jgi:Tfp pilus assembly protein PilF
MTRALNTSLNKKLLLGTLFVSMLLAFLVGMLGGCSRDPQVIKQKYLDKGKAYAEKGKCPEAEIEFQNAVQIDSKFEPAHYELALCYLKRGALQSAYLELKQAVQIAPDDLKANSNLPICFWPAGIPLMRALTPKSF